MGVFHGAALGEIGEEPDEDDENALQSSENLRISQMVKPKLNFNEFGDAYNVRSSIRLSKFGKRGKKQIGVGGNSTDSGGIMGKWIKLTHFF